MCGICGMTGRVPLSDEDFLSVNAMNRELFHRGPDSEGFYRNSNVALAMRRLKIIDLAGGDQPLFNEDSSLVLVANGEIYNHVELREDLEKKGHLFRTHSDCETILHLYEEKGENCLHDLRGMFAFALFDVRRKRLFLARDRLSEKPLYYYMGQNVFVFSSEMKSLLAHLRGKYPALNSDAINMYFHYQYVPEPHTCVEGVKKLPAAHYMVISLDEFAVTLKKYWDLEEVKPLYGNPRELVREAFDDLSRFIIRADVPVGISLSGGIDSGAIAVFAAKYYREKMHAFSVGYPGRPDNDEREMAMKLAAKVGLKYHDIELRTEDLVNSFPELVYYMDDPIADIAAFGYYSVNKIAREHGIPVLLSGLGGDELFWGYEWVRTAVKQNMDKKRAVKGHGNFAYVISNALASTGISGKKWILHNPVNALKGFLGHIRDEKRKLDVYPNRYIFYDKVPDFIGAFDLKAGLYTDEFRERVDDEVLYGFFTDDDWHDIPIKLCKFLFQVWLFSNCVALGDRMSMASSVESRLPFLDYRFVELVMGLRKANNDDYKLGYKKWFIDSMNDIIPREVMKRKKRGFTPPTSEWFEAIIREYGELCYDGCIVSSGLVDKNKLKDFFQSTFSPGGNLFFAYKMVLLEMWMRRIFLGEKHV